ncbi:MAG: PadR family transcriptional regulator [Spirochaetota bacterium]
MPKYFSGYDPDQLRGNTESMLLFLIDELEQTYGYRIIKEIERRSGGFFRFKEGTVYPALRKLENEGLLKGEWKKLRGGQERRYYRVTAKGKEVLQKKLAMWHNFARAMELIFNPAAAG